MDNYTVRKFVMGDAIGLSEFYQLINDGYNFFENGDKRIRISRIPAHFILKTKFSELRVSPNIHALYRAFGLWQRGELD